MHEARIDLIHLHLNVNHHLHLCSIRFSAFRLTVFTAKVRATNVKCRGERGESLRIDVYRRVENNRSMNDLPQRTMLVQS